MRPSHRHHNHHPIDIINIAHIVASPPASGGAGEDSGVGNADTDGDGDAAADGDGEDGRMRMARVARTPMLMMVARRARG